METAKKASNDNSTRRLARLAAVQGLYQIALLPEPVETLIRRFRDNPAVLLQEERTSIDVDVDLFAKILEGVTEHREELDGMIAGAVDAKLSLARMENLLKAILRAGAFELWQSPEIASGIILNDYVDVAHGFFDAKEPGLVNAILDKVAKKLRA